MAFWNFYNTSSQQVYYFLPKNNTNKIVLYTRLFHITDVEDKIMSCYNFIKTLKVEYEMSDQEITVLMQRLKHMLKFQYPLLTIGYFRNKIETGVCLVVQKLFTLFN